MKRNSLKSEELDERGGEHVLRGMLLHMIESPRPVDGAVNLRRRDWPLDNVNDFVAVLVRNVDYSDIVQLAGVERLAARGGVKRGAIESQMPAFAGRLARDHGGVEFTQERVVVIQPLRCRLSMLACGIHRASYAPLFSAFCQASLYL